jgi:carboxyl-terminal processing protease
MTAKYKWTLCSLVLFFSFSFLFQWSPVSWAEDRYSELQNFSKVLNLIQQHYVEPVDTKKLIYGAIKGMLRELDPHTNFMTPEIYKDFERETGGEFGGIGIEISVQNSVLTIISPIEDTPAWKAGIKAGDKIVAIDGKSTKGLSLVEASQLMRGKTGKKITLKIIRGTSDQPMDFTITRGNVRLRSVKYTNLENGYGYFKIVSFIENTAHDLETLIQKHIKENKNVSGILLDLRKNPGGLLDQAVRVSDMFLKEGVIVSTMGRDPKQKEVTLASKKGKFIDFPIVVLVDAFSASASEIVSGALRDNKRALIVGERTFGKGSVQTVVKLADGSALKLTVARYYTPGGISIQAEGITPDVVIESIETEVLSPQSNKATARSTREKDIQGHLKGDREKDSDTIPTFDPEGIAWWRDLGDKKESQLSDKEKLFKSDYQAFQAFNYLKTWKTIRQISQ